MQEILDILSSASVLGAGVLALVAFAMGWVFSPDNRSFRKEGDRISGEGEPRTDAPDFQGDIRIQKHDSEAEKVNAQLEYEVAGSLANEDTDPYESELERLDRLRADADERAERIEKALTERRRE